MSAVVLVTCSVVLVTCSVVLVTCSVVLVTCSGHNPCVCLMFNSSVGHKMPVLLSQVTVPSTSQSHTACTSIVWSQFVVWSKFSGDIELWALAGANPPSY